MERTNPSLKQHSRPRGHASVLDGYAHIRGLPQDKQSPVEDARAHPERARECKSVLDGPSCILGMPD